MRHLVAAIVCPLRANTGKRSRMFQQCEQSVAAFLLAHVVFGFADSREARRYPANYRDEHYK